MSGGGNSNKGYMDIASLVRTLTCKVTGVSPDAVAPFFTMAMKALGSSNSRLCEDDEFRFVENVKKKLVMKRRERDALTFVELHQKLQSSPVLKRRWAIVSFLSLLCDSSLPQENLGNSSWRNSSNQLDSVRSGVGRDGHRGSGHSSSQFATDNQTSETYGGPGGDRDVAVACSPPKAIGNKIAALLSMWQPNDDRVVVKQKCSGVISRANASRQIPEAVLLREILYCMQGIEGKIITFDKQKDAFIVDPKCGISNPLRSSLSRFSELGWFFVKIKKYCDSHKAEKTFGLVGQAFLTALHQELIEYYRLLAVLESQLQLDGQASSSEHSGLTLRRLAVWAFDPMHRMKVLAALTDTCRGVRGGLLITTIHSYMTHGDPDIRQLVQRILAVICVPVYAMLRQWILDGELKDNFEEFFIASDPSINNDKLWHEKYSIRKKMVPSFITMAQVQKILSAGKSLNFLSQVCHDRMQLQGLDTIRAKLETTNAEALFNEDYDSELYTMIEKAYTATSSHVLKVMHEEYKFMNHLQALRRYLLLGQGDFIQHLLNLVENDLSKPASMLYSHNITGVLETAIRGTNAQYDDPDILKRLDVRLLEVSPGDFGWDVFSLDYHVDGPIGTIFTKPVMITYLKLFNSLWRAKRMEYVLSAVWQEEMKHARILKDIPELAPVLHQCHIIASEVVHFVQQMQYYITFEVMECSWDVLERKVKSARDLDQVIAAHEEFLDTLMIRGLLDKSSENLQTQLRAIYDIIIKFQSTQSQLFEGSMAELTRRQNFAKGIDTNSEKGRWGTEQISVESESLRCSQFVKKFISSTRAQLRMLSDMYQDLVHKFLLMLTSHNDVSLQFLSFRLDFNEHYKTRNSRLVTSLTYQHRRLSTRTPSAT